MVCTTFQSPFGGPSRAVKPSTRRTLRTAQQQQQQELQQSQGAAEETFVVGDVKAKSYFQPWIEQDFALWEQGGIKMVRSYSFRFNSPSPGQCLHTQLQRLFCAMLVQSAVTEMALRYRECFGEVFRFQVINGTLWVDHISERHDGWYPSRMGEGNICCAPCCF